VTLDGVFGIRRPGRRIVRVKVKLVAFRVADVLFRSTDLAIVRLFIVDSGNSSNVVAKVFRVGGKGNGTDVWYWLELQYANPPRDGQFRCHVQVRDGQEPINSAIDGAEMLVA
jgi:hypothetical protein